MLSEDPFCLRRYAVKPRPQKPRIIIAQVEGSGTAAWSVSVPTRNPSGPDSKMSLPWTVCEEDSGEPAPKRWKVPPDVETKMPVVSRATTLVPVCLPIVKVDPTGNRRLSPPDVSAPMVSPPISPVIAVMVSPPDASVTVNVHAGTTSAQRSDPTLGGC
jgi:hypothetical protein